MAELANALAQTGSRQIDRPALSDMIGSRSVYALELEMFEGPLDLLLHLVRRHELDILMIPIAFVAEKYIRYIRLAHALDIDIAGEYLVMAATLAFLKSRELLPGAGDSDAGDAGEESGGDPRAELIRRLVEYERFKRVAEGLGERPLVGRDVFLRGQDPDFDVASPGLAPVTMYKLAEALTEVLDRAKIRKNHEVEIEPVTVRQRMVQLSVILTENSRVNFVAIFLGQTWETERHLRQFLVVTLMSVLEMAKLGVLGVEQAEACGDLEVYRTVEIAELERVVADFRDDDEVTIEIGKRGKKPKPKANVAPAAAAQPLPDSDDSIAQESDVETGENEELS